MSGSTVTRREISLNWRSQTKATGASITVPESVDEVDIPLIDLLKDNEQPGWFFDDADYPGEGYIFERDGFAPIIIAVDNPNMSGLAGFLNGIEALLNTSPCKAEALLF